MEMDTSALLSSTLSSRLPLGSVLLLWLSKVKYDHENGYPVYVSVLIVLIRSQGCHDSSWRDAQCARPIPEYCNVSTADNFHLKSFIDDL